MKPYNGLHGTEGCRVILKDQYKALKVRARRVLGRAMRQEIEDYGSSNRANEKEEVQVKQKENSATSRRSTEKETDAQAETEGLREAQAKQEKEVPDNWNHRPSWVWERDGCGLP